MTSSKYASIHHPCAKCGSSDAAVTYKDGMTKCFSCGSSYPSQKGASINEMVREISTTKSVQLQDVASYEVRGFRERQITRQICEEFGVRVGYDEARNIAEHYYPYTKRGKVVAYKLRQLPKAFRTIGDFNNTELFGQSRGAIGKKLVITEGELDTLAVAQAYQQHYNKIFSVVSLPSASGVACAVRNLDFINQFQEVILLLDNDEAGLKATQELARAIGYGKVYIGTLKEKDASDELLSHGPDAIIQAIWNAKLYSPAGIVSGEELWDAYVERQSIVSHPYPECMTGVNDKTQGMRMGEIVLFTSGTGSGKSTLIKEIILHLLGTTEEKIGVVSLEESPGDTVEKLIRMNCRKLDPSEDEARAAFERITKDDRLLLLDHQGSISDGGLIDQMKFLAAIGCKYIILDHLTIAVSEGAEGMTGNEAIDKVMSDLLKLVKQYNIWLGVISHLRKAAGGTSFEEGKLASLDDMKGSGSIKQIAFDVIAFARNLIAETEDDRNKMQMAVLKSRYTGLTGPAGSAQYDKDTTRLSYINIEDMFNA